MSNTSKPGHKTSEFKVVVGSLLGAALGAKFGVVSGADVLDFAQWVIGAYCGTRAASKFGADELVELGTKAVRNATSKPAKLSDAAKAASRL